MRFCDFFIEYKIGLKELKTSIPWIKLPLYRKIFIVFTFLLGAATIILFVIKPFPWALISLFLTVLLIGIFTKIDSTKKNLRKMLDEHYVHHSQDRINMLLKILEMYNIDATDTNSIDLLIEQASEDKSKYNPFTPIKGPLKTLASIIIPILAYVATTFAEAIDTKELITISLQLIIIILCVSSMIFSLLPIIKDMLYSDSNKYDELIYDLKQLKLFKENTKPF